PRYAAADRRPPVPQSPLRGAAAAHRQAQRAACDEGPQRAEDIQSTASRRMSKLQITSVYQGDTARLPFEAQDTTGAPENLDGCSIRWALSKPEAIDSPVLTKTSENGITIIDAAARS